MNPCFKEFTPTDCALKDTRIDIWEFPLHTEFTEASALLNNDETARAQRFHFARHKRRYTVARAMLRLILAHYLQSSPSTLKFTYNAHGKPKLSDSPLQFNLSHSGELALLAVGKDFPMGIDVEFFSARPYEGIGKQLFSNQEMMNLKQVNEGLKPLAFFHIWAQKEALIKACGLGLAYPTQDFDVPPLPSVNDEIIDNLHKKTWKMVSFMPQVACNAALCHDPLVADIRYLKIKECHTIISYLGNDV